MIYMEGERGNLVVLAAREDLFKFAGEEERTEDGIICLKSVVI